jgi:hypothetical protein
LSDAFGETPKEATETVALPTANIFEDSYNIDLQSFTPYLSAIQD